MLIFMYIENFVIINEPFLLLNALIDRCTKKTKEWKKMIDDTTLVELMQNGSKEAFDLLYERYKNSIIRTAYLIVGNRADSEDIAQETFVKCYLHCRELKDLTLFKSWLYQIMTRTAWQYGRKQNCQRPDENIMEIADWGYEKDALSKILQSEQEKLLRREIEKLDIKHRTVIIYFYYEELSVKEIARICNCLEGTVKSRLFHARKQLKQSLVKNHQEVIGYEKSEQF